MTTRVTEGARRERCCARFSRLAASPLNTPLTKSEEKERLLTVYQKNNQFCSSATVLDRSDSVGFLKTNRYAEKIPVTNNKGSPELTPEAMHVIVTFMNTEISISDLTINHLFKT